MPFYNIESLNNGMHLGTYEADSKNLALRKHAQDVGYSSIEEMLDVLHGAALRKWISDHTHSEVDVGVVAREALDVLADDLAAGTDGSYEMPARRTVSGVPETFRLKNEFLIVKED